MVGYRIVEIKKGKVMSLFHGTDGSRTIPIGVWHKANVKEVIDGSRGTPYTAGWHFLESRDDAESFFERMFRIKEDRYVIRCHVRGNIRPKRNSKKGSCLLADEIMIKHVDVAWTLCAGNDCPSSLADKATVF